MLPMMYFTFNGCIPYLFHVGSEQGRILWHREKIDTIIKNETLDTEGIQKLKLIQKAREFSISKLALNEKGGFEYFTKLDREEIGWNVSACEQLAFKSYTWWFPIAGTVPYKGYFDKSLAIEEENNLKSKGYDTRVRAIGGYSTLGWFSDPVLSPQLKWENFRLVGLVIHEMAHATAYLPGDSNLNESYASFVEEKGMEMYYELLEGKNSKTLQEAKKSKSRRKEIFSILKKHANLLELLYNSNQTKEEKLFQKQKIISEFKEEILKLKIIPEDKMNEFRKREWNNEDFLGVLRYHSGSEEFELLFQKSDRDFKTFHMEVKKIFSLPTEERKKILNLPD